jgi:hypothetical protein
LAETAAKVKEGWGRNKCQSQVEEHTGIGRIGRDGELEEAELANTGIGVDGPDRVALSRSVKALCAAIVRRGRRELTRVHILKRGKAAKEPGNSRFEGYEQLFHLMGFCYTSPRFLELVE